MRNRDVKEQIRVQGLKNRPFTIVLGLVFGIASIFTDFYLGPERRELSQKLIWSICTIGLLLVAYGKLLRRSKLALAFTITLIVHCALVYLAAPLFPLSNSLVVFFFWAPETVLLLITFGILAKLLDPNGPRS